MKKGGTQMPNPINPAMDKLLFTTDTDEVYDLMEKNTQGGEPWVVLGAQIVDGKREWMLGRVSADQIPLLPGFLPLYQDDFVTTLRKLVANGVPVNPPLSY